MEERLYVVTGELNETAEIIEEATTGIHSFIHSRHDYMFVSWTNHAFSCNRLITIAQCRLQLSTNKMYYIITTTKLQIGYSIVSLCRIYVYYDVVNVLWAHRNKNIRKLHMHRGLKDFLNLFFSLFFSICANVFSFILLSFPWFCKRH
jgi:hypothetical protein